MTATDRRAFLQHATGLVAAMSLEPDPALLAARWHPGRPVAIGVIGAGRQGREILGELAKFENAPVAAVCDLDATRLARGVRRTKDAKGYEKWEEMLAKESGIQACVVATPTHLHEEIAIRLLEAGKHVYCEAPMAGSIAGAKALARAAAAAKTVFQVGHPARSNPVYKLARSFYRSDSIQRLVALRAAWRRKTTWRTPASDPAQEKSLNWRLYRATSTGLPGEEGSHQFDAVTWFTGKTPVSVRGSGGILVHEDGREVPDTVHCAFRYESGVEFGWEATLANSYEGAHELFVGSMGAIRMAERFGWLFKEADAPIQGWEVYASRQHFHNEEGITLIADATKLASQGKLKEGIGLPNPPLYYALEAFLKSVAESQPVACTALDGLQAAVLGICAHEAVTGGGEVLITPALLKPE